MERLDWKPGDRIIVMLEDSKIVLEKAEIRVSRG